MRLSLSTKPVSVYFLDRGSLKLYSSEPLTSTALSAASRCQIEYLNEGGANFVFTIRPAAGKELPTRLQSKLLRLRKNIPNVQGPDEHIKSLKNDFRDLFPVENLIQYERIDLDTGVTALLNENLRTLVRPRQRAGDFLPEDELSGLLVTDMSPLLGEVLLELKPKWLTQSPNAPPEAKRCRTCAMRAQRASQGICTSTDAQENCPLDLVNTEAEGRAKAISAITTDELIQDYLTTQAQTLFQQLRARQLMLDGEGILKTSGATGIYDLCKAMTLRDCTLFVKRSGEHIQAKIGDLDLKQPEKLSRWKKVEHTLIADGWYTNTENSQIWAPEKICLLSR